MKRFVIALWMVFGIVCVTFGEDEFKPMVDFKGSRLAIGYLDSGSNGTYPEGSYQMPEVKLRFNLQMTPDMKITLRMNLNNASFNNNLDYLYMDYTNLLATAAPSLKDSSFNPTLRIGRFKLDIGEETWGNNSVEAASVTPSVTNTGAYDEGMQLFQTLPKDKIGIPVKWSLSLTNGNSGTGADNQQAKALCLKIGINPINELYISSSYYNSGELLNSNAEMTYAGLATPPTSATRWTRTITEIDLRYDIQPGKENRLEPGAPAWSDSMAFFRVAYGQFKDDGKDTVAPIVAVTDRKGSYYFVEGTYNATEKLYLTSRYSMVEFDKNTLYASLNGVNANGYTRISGGVGYRLSGNTHIKAEYVTNDEDVPTGTAQPKDNQYAVLITTKF